jgi:hypothetical protein
MLLLILEEFQQLIQIAFSIVIFDVMHTCSSFGRIQYNDMHICEIWCFLSAQIPYEL